MADTAATLHGWTVAARRWPRHTLVVRVTHWLSALCVAALLLSGVEILISHPRFYWGETGNSGVPALFTIPIPASRGSVPTGYGYVLPDQNGWSRSLHFQTAWLMAFTGLFYLVHALRSGHLRRNLWPSAVASSGYNRLQRTTYLSVVFGLVPFLMWTGLAMSPGFTAVFPFVVNSLGGQQSARTLHFFATLALVAFVLGHVFMVWRAGFLARTRAMITGGAES